VTEEEVLSACQALVEQAHAAGATAAEAMATWEQSVQTGLENNDLHSVESTQETVFGLRALVGESLGFVTVNSTDPEVLARCAAEAVAQARVTPEDTLNGLPEPERVTPVAGLYDGGTADSGVEATARAAVTLLDRICARDQRVRVDSGAVSATTAVTALASSTGVALTQRQTLAQAHVFGMAVDGDDVASFDYDGDAARSFARLETSLDEIADRFVAKCLSGLGAGKAHSFKGSVVLSPEAVGEFLLPSLITAISADAVRKGRSRFVSRLGTSIASPHFTLIDDGSIAGGVMSSAFDREGVPLRRRVLVDRGVLTTYLYNHYEARGGGKDVRSTGHAVGSAASLPAIGPSRLEVAPGIVAMNDLSLGKGPVVWVGRFSGSTNPVTGEFSGVVKNGFWVEAGSRRPVRETLIAGNLFDALGQISAVSREQRSIGGTRLLPAVRLDDVSVTAG
jgi:PmbA protein